MFASSSTTAMIGTAAIVDDRGDAPRVGDVVERVGVEQHVVAIGRQSEEEARVDGGGAQRLERRPAGVDQQLQLVVQALAGHYVHAADVGAGEDAHAAAADQRRDAL